MALQRDGAPVSITQIMPRTINTRCPTTLAPRWRRSVPEKFGSWNRPSTTRSTRRRCGRAARGRSDRVATPPHRHRPRRAADRARHPRRPSHDHHGFGGDSSPLPAHRSRTAAGRSDLAYSSSTRRPKRSLQCDLLYLDTVGVRAERSAPTTYAASVSISSCRTNRTDSRIRPAPSRHESPPATPAASQNVGVVIGSGQRAGRRLGGCSAEVMPMPRQPEVFVHELEPEQAQRLVRIARTSKDRVRLRRAGIVLASVQGRPVCRPLPTSGLHRDDQTSAARGRDHLAGPQNLEGQPRPGLRREDGPHPRPV